MTHYLCYNGLKEINNNICPPTPASTYVRNTPPQNVIFDEEGRKWTYTGERYQWWPVYVLEN